MGEEEKNTTKAASTAASTVSNTSTSSQPKKIPAQWLKEKKLKSYYLAGLLKYTGWENEKLVTETEFSRQLNAWLNRSHGNKGRS